MAGVDIPLGIQAYAAPTAGLPPVELINLYVEPDESGATTDKMMRLQRPGLTKLATLPGAIRGIYQSDGVANGATFVVAYDRLLMFNNDNSVTNVGTVAVDSSDVRWAASFNTLALTSGGNLYLYVNSILTQVVMPDSKQAIDVEQMDNYLVIATPDGRFYWIEPGESDLNTDDGNALNFATAESEADGLVAIHRVGDDLYMLGTQSIEVWQAVQTSTTDASPFQRQPGRNFSKGVKSPDTVLTVDNTMFWVSDQHIVYRAAEVPKRISTFTVETAIANATADCSACVVRVDAHEFYVLRCPGQGSFAYDCATGTWCRFKSFASIEWNINRTISVARGTLAADDTNIYLLDRTVATDAGQPIERIVSGAIALPTNRSIRNDSIVIEVGSSGSCQYRLRWHDGRTDYQSKPVILSARGGADQLRLFRLGAAQGGFRIFEISILDPVIARISGMTANGAAQ